VSHVRLLVLLALCSCASEVAGQGSGAAAEEAAGYTTDGDVPGVTILNSPRTAHTTEDVEYPESPPYGGDHDPAWADCTGTVYPEPIRSENAVHSLEHGAAWVLDTAVSVQSWARQLKVDTADDPRLAAFLRIYRMNPDITPEPGATCSNPEFASSPRGPDS
jgi:hypothetical protein